MRERLIAATIALALGWGAFVYGLRWLESLMTFRPDRTAMETPVGHVAQVEQFIRESLSNQR